MNPNAKTYKERSAESMVLKTVRLQKERERKELEIRHKHEREDLIKRQKA